MRFRPSYQSAFALPTVVITSLVLLILGLSTLQVSSSIARSLQDQHWQRLAKEAGQAGVAYAKSCLQKNGADYWSAGLAPNKNCKGGGTGGYVAQETSSTPNWKSTFAVTVPNAVNGSGSRVKSIGTVQLLSAGGVVLKTYTSEYTVVLNVMNTTSLSAKKVVVGRYYTCVLASDDQVYCSGYNANGELGNGNNANQQKPVKFNLPSGLSARDIVDIPSVVVESPRTTCVIASDNQLYCSGLNTSSQLGNGNTTSQSTPIKFPLPSGYSITQAYLTRLNICAIASNSANTASDVFCAGWNYYGQLGVGNTTTPSAPVKFGGTGTTNEFAVPQQVAIGEMHICVTTKDTELQNYNWLSCAGYNGYGALGNNTQTNQANPVVNSAVSSPATVATGYSHTCTAQTVDGRMYCTGYNGYGQLGIGNTTQKTVFTISTVPAFYTTDIQATERKTCLMQSRGQMYCSGGNDYGQLGIGNTTGQTNPVLFPVPRVAVRYMKIGYYQTCASAVADGQLYCAGYNNYGQLGNGSSASSQMTPVKFGTTTSDVRQVKNNVAIGENHTCALYSDNQVYCAGANTYGQLGDNTVSTRTSPVRFQLP